MHWSFSSSKRCCTKSPAPPPPLLLQWPHKYLNIFSGIKYLLNNHYIVIFLMIVVMTLTTITTAHDTTMQTSENNQQIENNALGDKNNNNNNNNNQINGAVGNSNLGIESRSSYAMLSQAMSHAVSHELNGGGSGAYPVDGSCLSDGIDCFENVHDRLGMEAIKSLHQQLDDDDNGNIDLTESDDFLREELKYDSGYEKRHKTFHYNDDTQISVKELWEAWLRSEVHNWTIEQTSDWLAQSVQLPQYVELFQKHKVSGETLPRMAVNNMHYISNVLGVRDPIHKQKIALKAMDVVLFGPPRETGTRWKDYILITLLLSAIIGCWYAYQQNKNAKIHLRRMVKDMEGLQKAENALTEMQKELERARLEQENVATEKLDLERRLKEAPSLSSSSSDLEVQQLKQEIEMLRHELSRAEVELVDHCWQPPVILQSWLQYTYELESKQTLKKRVNAEKQLQLARDACEKLKRKRSSLVGAFVSTHGKSIDDVDRSIVEARNSLGEVTNELQERLHRWKQIESLIGCSIVHNNGVQYLENVLYNNSNNNNNNNNMNSNIRNNGSGKMSRGRTLGSQDELDDESVQGYFDNHGRFYRDDSSCSDDCGISGDNNSVSFIVGNEIPLLRASSMGTASTPPTTPNQSAILIATALPITSASTIDRIPTHVATTNLPFSTQLSLQQQQQPQPQHFHNTSTNHQPNALLLADSSTTATTSTNVITQQQKINMQNHLRSINSNQINHNNNVVNNSNESNVIGNVSPHSTIVDDNSQIPVLNAKPCERIFSLKHNNNNNNNNLNSKKTLVLMNATTSGGGGVGGGVVVVGGNNGNYSTGSVLYGNSNNRMPHPRRTNSNQSVTITRTQSTEVEPMESYNPSHLATPSTSKALSAATANPHSDIQQLDDACSTDSSSFDGEFKKRRRKLHFPFGKKSNKNKIA